MEEARAGADDVERRATRADELARRRPELPLLNAIDGGGELGFERRDLGALEGRDNGLVGTLEEDVGDLDFFRSGPEGGEGVDEPLQHVVRLDRLRRGHLLETVRLVVDDEGTALLQAQEVEPPVQKDSVVLEGEGALGQDPI